MADTEIKNEEKTETKPAKEKGEKMVKIRLPLIPGAEKQEALFVSVNDREMVIPRGKTVEVPECFAEVIDHSEEMQIQAALKRQEFMKD
jgi:hypothetical protein